MGLGGEVRGSGWGRSDVNSKSAHAKNNGNYINFTDFAWVSHDPPPPSSF